MYSMATRIPCQYSRYYDALWSRVPCIEYWRIQLELAQSLSIITCYWRGRRGNVRYVPIWSLLLLQPWIDVDGSSNLVFRILSNIFEERINTFLCRSTKHFMVRVPPSIGESVIIHNFLRWVFFLSTWKNWLLRLQRRWMRLLLRWRRIFEYFVCR